MPDNVQPLFGERSGVVDFGVQIVGYTAVVEGREIPRLMVQERGEQITLIVDRRFAIDVPRDLSGRIAWLVAQALAIGEGYPFLGADTKDRPFAPQVMGPYGPPSTT